MTTNYTFKTSYSPHAEWGSVRYVSLLINGVVVDTRHVCGIHETNDERSRQLCCQMVAQYENVISAKLTTLATLADPR